MTKVFIDVYALDFTKDEPDAYSKYQHLVQHMFKYEAECIVPFEASSRTYMLNNFIFASSLTNTYRATLTRGADLIRTSAWDYVLVLLYREHPVRIKTEHGEFDINPDQLLFVDLSKPITIYTQSVNVLSFNIPRAMLTPLVPINDGFHGMVLREEPHARLLVNYMKTLEHVAADIQSKDVATMTDSMLRMVANCLTNAGASTQQEADDDDLSKIKVSLLQIKHAIDTQITDPNLSIDSLTQQFHISRATIYRMFEPLGGVVFYIQNRKLDYAYRALSQSRETSHNLSKLAYMLGFSHPSSLTRAFKTKFGISPREVKVISSAQPNQEVPWHFDIDLAPYKR